MLKSICNQRNINKQKKNIITLYNKIILFFYYKNIHLNVFLPLYHCLPFPLRLHRYYVYVQLLLLNKKTLEWLHNNKNFKAQLFSIISSFRLFFFNFAPLKDVDETPPFSRGMNTTSRLFFHTPLNLNEYLRQVLILLFN